jgi:hypothetical protein
MIVRFYSEGKPHKIRERGLTLEQAQAHCQKETTHKKGVWFDGYTKEQTYR